MTDVVGEFVGRLAPAVRPLAGDVIAAVRSCGDFDVAVKWRQLTFAVDGDFDHWVCAVSATKSGVDLKLHFGAMLTDTTGAFLTDDSKFVRKVRFGSAGDVVPQVVADLVGQAVRTLPEFRRVWQERP